VEVHRVIRSRGFHIFETTGSQMAVKSLTHQPVFNPQEDSWYSFVLEVESISGSRNRSLEKSNDLIGNRTRDFPAYRVVPQPITLLRAPLFKKGFLNKILYTNFLRHAASRTRPLLLRSLYSNGSTWNSWSEKKKGRIWLWRGNAPSLHFGRCQVWLSSETPPADFRLVFPNPYRPQTRLCLEIGPYRFLP
jgi:hypothetical protein